MMTQKQAADFLSQSLHNWVEQYFKSFPGLIGVLQFGSTIKAPLKHETDLDLLLVFETLPNSRWDQFQLTANLENKLNADLKKIDGFHIEVSFILKQESQLDHLSSFYLDFIDTSKIWFDPKGVLNQLLKDINNWISENGSYKVKKGNLWYWVYSSKPGSHTTVSFKFSKKSIDSKG
ncbi:MAG TPA: hypothetical protein VIG33_05465 [Pseudobdellovibrionaceae bacterium]|jgi:predicted nucleotidyltransferase